MPDLFSWLRGLDKSTVEKGRAILVDEQAERMRRLWPLALDALDEVRKHNLFCDYSGCGLCTAYEQFERAAASGDTPGYDAGIEVGGTTHRPPGDETR